MAEVVLQQVRKVYPGMTRDAVENCSLEIRDHEFMVLVGPSGCGKSTTLRMVAGLEAASSGEIRIGARRVNEVAPKDRDIAMVFQNYALYPHMNVYKNMAFGLMMAKFPKAEIDRRVREAAEILGIGDLLDRRPKALSGGQRQRVAVGRAIVRKPQVFLFDEPLSNLDARLRVQMRAELKKLHRTLNATMIYVTHDQVEAMTMGDRICVMKDGRIQQVGEPLEIYRQPANQFVAGFLGAPPMNFLRGEIVGEGSELFFAGAGLKFAIAASHAESLRARGLGPVTLGIRAEDIGNAARPGEDHAWQPIEGTVEVVEPMGAETFIDLTSAGQRITARAESRAKIPEPGGLLKLYLDAAQAHYFEIESELRIV